MGFGSKLVGLGFKLNRWERILGGRGLQYAWNSRVFRTGMGLSRKAMVRRRGFLLIVAALAGTALFAGVDHRLVGLTVASTIAARTVLLALVELV